IDRKYSILHSLPHSILVVGGSSSHFLHTNLLTMTTHPSLRNQFVVASNFVKMNAMPDHRVYAVKKDEMMVEGRISCYTRQKGLLRDVISPLATRQIVLTKTGYILIWMKPTKGLTIRLSAVIDVVTKTSALKCGGGIEQRCQVKMHFSFGTLNLILTNDQIDKWRNLLLASCDIKSPVCIPTARNVLVETATFLSLVPPLPFPQRGFITSSVIFHRSPIHSIDSMDERRNNWAEMDTMPPPSSKVEDSFPIQQAAEMVIPPSKMCHVTKSTVLPCSLYGTGGAPVTLSTSHSDIPSGCVPVPERWLETARSKEVKRWKKSIDEEGEEAMDGAIRWSNDG
ncbi:hypothetical protein PMAYCL1PPCAC_18171, partial [Pristionchus mayeri]